MIRVLACCVLVAAIFAVAVAVPAANAAVGGLPTGIGHADSSPEWERLREKMFGARRVETNSGRVQLLVPLRAAYGASVPVRCGAGLFDRRKPGVPLQLRSARGELKAEVEDSKEGRYLGKRLAVQPTGD